MEDALRQAVEAAAGRAEVGAAVCAVYDALAAAIDERRPACVMSGRCCRFEEYGHRLFVTTLELAAFSRGKDEGGRIKAEGSRATPPSSLILHPSSLPPACPFQVGKLCGVHPIRPFGCRMFFCDPSSTEWQNEAYERFHAEIRSLHESLAVPYFYIEWRAALRMLGWACSP